MDAGLGGNAYPAHPTTANARLIRGIARALCAIAVDTIVGVPLTRIEIRPEIASDIDDIREINVEAFRNHLISRQTEHLIVDALRDNGALEVSLVAVTDGRTVGHIAFSKVGVGDSESDWYLLGPVSVEPDMQGQGVGSALVQFGLEELRTRHASGCVLVGDPGYYSRFGFSTFPDLSYEGVPHEYVLGLSFSAAISPCGLIVANKAFDIEPD
ncbi:MAG: N-acetyltransferase [Coriobacteriia bacterium]|nr:N-acetyltransferase [Coriobacteriia bacterium]MBN2822286.1 N-acetyltransferase [Coriobacteriia bacterium]